jgi:hypothetical protein
MEINGLFVCVPWPRVISIKLSWLHGTKQFNERHEDCPDVSDSPFLARDSQIQFTYGKPISSSSDVRQDRLTEPISAFTNLRIVTWFNSTLLKYLAEYLEV